MVPSFQPSSISVVAGVLFCPQKGFLIAQRPKGKSFCDFWEFPGGKMESTDSSYEAALERELQEEIGIKLDISKTQHLLSITGKINKQTIFLKFYFCPKWENNPHPKENQILAWVSAKELGEFKLLPLNRKILPKLLKNLSIYI